MKKIYLVLTSSTAVFLLLGAGVAQSQIVSLSPSSVTTNQNSNFSISVNINSVTNLFSTYFDLDFNSSLISFVNATEGTFMSQGCQTSLMSAENPAGKLIVGLTRLGEPCGGVSGSGALMTLNFRALSQNGTSNMSFSNNGLTVYNSGTFSDIVGTWSGGNVTINQTTDTTPPGAPTGVTVF